MNNLIERALPGQGAEVARLIARSLAADLRRMTIWESPRAGRYVEALLAGTSPDHAAEFYLLRSGGVASGVAAFRRLEGGAFLNHIYIAPELRGRSLGAGLLAEATRRYLERHGAGWVALEVFAGRPEAEEVQAWYQRLGFVERRRWLWWIAPTAAPAPDPGPTGEAACENLEDAERQHRAWGFSNLRMRTSGGRIFQVGRLGALYFRLGESEAAGDPQLGAALARLDPARGWLLVVPTLAAPTPGPSDWRLAGESRRLECPAAELLERLAVRRRRVA